MPRYFFHVHDGREIRDGEGTVLPDLDAARVEAVRLAGSLLKDRAREFWNGEAWQMDVRDKAGKKLFTLNFSAS